jgi:hypothetical protein
MLALLLLAPHAHAKPKVFTAVRIDLEGRAGLCPGEFQKLDVFGTEDGKESKVKAGSWKDFSITWELGPVSPKGALEMPLAPEATWGKTGRVEVKLLADPSIQAEAFLPARYDCSMVIDRSGEVGPAGAGGEDGSSEADADGGDGQNGQGGRSGGPGHDLEVKVFLIKEPVRGVDVLQIKVTDLTTHESWNSAVAADGGKFIVRAAGGMGGPGGAGGDGGSGATERDGGDGADGGEGGDGGVGGKITVLVDPNANGRTTALVVENGGGPPGPGGSAGDGGQAFDPGSPGAAGHAGHDGEVGPPGPPPDVRFEPVGQLF